MQHCTVVRNLLSRLQALKTAIGILTILFFTKESDVTWSPVGILPLHVLRIFPTTTTCLHTERAVSHGTSNSLARWPRPAKNGLPLTKNSIRLVSLPSFLLWINFAAGTNLDISLLCAELYLSNCFWQFAGIVAHSARHTPGPY